MKQENCMIEKKLQDEIIEKNRNFTKGYRDDAPAYEEDFESDQQLQKPQPPLVKAAMRGEGDRVKLPFDFDKLDIKNDTVALFRDRHSSRVYTGESMSLLQLSFLLWATQGIKDIRGKSYATLRTVASGGARHPFETYLIVSNVEGLAPGRYHYLPMEHAVEFLGAVDNENAIAESLCFQNWALKANVIFYWSMVAYRAEWRYGIFAHRTALMDAGHVGENLYLAAEAAGLGCCGIAAFHHESCCRLFELDGNEEYIVYTMPVGTISEKDKAKEKAFYKFVEDEGL